MAGVENRSLVFAFCRPFRAVAVEKLTQAKAWAMLSCPFRAQIKGSRQSLSLNT